MLNFMTISEDFRSYQILVSRLIRICRLSVTLLLLYTEENNFTDDINQSK